VTISAFSGDGANVRRPVRLMKAKGSSRGEPNLPDFLKDAPELWRWHETNGSICIQEGQPRTSLILLSMPETNCAKWRCESDGMDGPESASICARQGRV
jgi:hypothetical protein